MSDQPGQSPESVPAKKRGVHKPECKCGWCETKRRNLAKRNAEPKPAQTTQAAQSIEPPAASQPAKPADSVPANQPNIAAKIKAREAKRKNETQRPIEKTSATDHKPAKQTGFFASLFSGPNTFFEG